MESDCQTSIPDGDLYRSPHMCAEAILTVAVKTGDCLRTIVIACDERVNRDRLFDRVNSTVSRPNLSSLALAVQKLVRQAHQTVRPVI